MILLEGERLKGSPRDDGIKFSEKSFRRMREHENVSFHEKWKKKNTSFSLQKLLLENKRAGIKRSINIQFVFPV